MMIIRIDNNNDQLLFTIRSTAIIIIIITIIVSLMEDEIDEQVGSSLYMHKWFEPF